MVTRAAGALGRALCPRCRSKLAVWVSRSLEPDRFAPAFATRIMMPRDEGAEAIRRPSNGLHRNSLLGREVIQSLLSNDDMKSRLLTVLICIRLFRLHFLYAGNNAILCGLIERML